MNNETNNIEIQPDANTGTIKPIDNNEKNIDESIKNAVPTPLKPEDQIPVIQSKSPESAPTPQVVEAQTEPQIPSVAPNGQIVQSTQEPQPVQTVGQAVEQPPQVQPTIQNQPVEEVQQPVPQVNSTTPQQVQGQPTQVQEVVQQQVDNMEPIQSITTSPTKKSSIINGVVDQTNIGFVATGTALKKKKNPKLVAALVIAIVAVVGTLGYLFIYPWVVQKFFIKPKTAFTTVINDSTKEINTVIDDLVHNRGTIDAKISLETNIPALSKFSGYTYGAKVGVDYDRKTAELGYSIANHNTEQEYSEYYYLKNDSYYKRYSTNRDLLYLPDLTDKKAIKAFDLISNLESRIKPLNSNDFKSIVNNLSSSLINSIPESKLTKEEMSYTVNGEAVKALRNKYVLSKEDSIKTINTLVDSIVNDENAMKLLDQVFDIKEKDIKNISNTKIDDTNLTISIITTGNKMIVSGYEVNYGDFNLTCYKLKGNYNVNIKAKDDGEDVNIVITTVKSENGKIDISVKRNDKNAASFVINKWTNEEKTLDFSIIDSEGKAINGTMNLNLKKTDKNMEGKISINVKNGSIFLNSSLEFYYDWSGDVANVNVSTAQQKSAEELNSYQSSFDQYVYSTPLGELFKTISGDIDPDINDYYDDNDFIDSGDDLNDNDDTSIEAEA